MNDKIYNSKDILDADELYDIQEKVCSFGQTIKYQMTKDEIEWFEFIHGRYSIGDYVNDNTDGDFILTLDCYEMSQALDNDNPSWGKATMLSDDTALQRLFFWCYIEPE